MKFILRILTAKDLLFRLFVNKHYIILNNYTIFYSRKISNRVNNIQFSPKRPIKG